MCVCVCIYIYIPKSTQDLVTTLILGIKEVRFKIPLCVFKKCSRSLHWELLWKRINDKRSCLLLSRWLYWLWYMNWPFGVSVSWIVGLGLYLSNTLMRKMSCENLSWFWNIWKSQAFKNNYQNNFICLISKSVKSIKSTQLLVRG